MANHFTYFHKIKKENFSSGLGSLSTSKTTDSMVYIINT